MVEGAGEHVELLLAGELDEVHCVAGDSNREVRVLLRVLDGILKGGAVEDVDVRVVQAVGGTAFFAGGPHIGEALFVGLGGHVFLLCGGRLGR